MDDKEKHNASTNMQNITPGDLYVVTDNASYIPGILCMRHRIDHDRCFFIAAQGFLKGKVICSSDEIKRINSPWHVYDLHMEELHRWNITDMHPMKADDYRRKVRERQHKKTKDKKDDNSN